MKLGHLLTKRIFAFGTLAGIAILAACGGGGGGSSSTVPPSARLSAPLAIPSSGGSTGTTSAARLSLTIPNSTTAASFTRQAKTIAATTNGVVVTLVKSDNTSAAFAPVTFDVSASSTLCTTSGTGRSCSLTIAAPIGNDIFTVDTFSSATAASGTKSGSGVFKMSVVQNAANSASVTIGGPIASALLISSVGSYASFSTPNSPSTPYPTSARIYVVGLDTAGAVILAPDTFTSPVTLTIGNAYGGAANRHPQFSGPTPTPTPISTPAAILSVTPVGGTTTSTSAGVSSISVNSPSDVVTITTQAIYGSATLQVTASVATSAPAPYNSGNALIFNVYGPYPTPAPTPAPTPGLTFVQQTVTSDLHWSPYAQAWQFPSAADTTQAKLTVLEATAGFTGNITFTDTSAIAGSCARLISSDDMRTPIAFPLSVAYSNSGGAPFAFYGFGPATPSPTSAPPSGPTPTPAPTATPAGPGTCSVTASDGTNSTTLTVYLNAFSGTVN